LKQMFPGTVEMPIHQPSGNVPSTVPTLQSTMPAPENYGVNAIAQPAEQIPDLTGAMLDHIVQWLESDYWRFDTPLDFWQIMIHVSGHQTLQEAGNPVDSPMPLYYTILIERIPVVLKDRRWWMEVAVRKDTGEPVASMNHEGSFEDYKIAMQTKGKE
jgi:hypothetical protein